MSRVKYSKKRMVGQSRTSNLKYMQPLKPGTVLHVEDTVEGSFIGPNGQEVMNDTILCRDADGQAIKVPVREYAKMDIDGQPWDSEGDSDEIFLPESITIISSEDRVYTPQGGEEQKLYPTFAYNDAEAFVASQGGMEFDDLVKSGVKEDNNFAPVQNYTVQVK